MIRILPCRNRNHLPAIQRSIRQNTVWIRILGELHSQVHIEKVNLIAHPDRPVIPNLRNDILRRKIDDTRRNRNSHVKHRPQHPRAMLLNLLPTDIPPTHENSNGGKNPHKRLHRMAVNPISALLVPDNDERSSVADQAQQQDDVPIEAVEQDPFVADDGGELEGHEDAGGEDGGKVDEHAVAVGAAAEVVPVAGDKGEVALEVAVVVEVAQAREGEAEHAACEDYP